MAQTIELDQANWSNHGYELQLWSRFYPTPYYFYLELRNAIMLEKLFNSIQALALGGLDIQTASRLNTDTIALIVGKSHVFGMMEMWNHVMENLAINPRSGRRGPLTSDPLPDLSDLVPGKTDYDIVTEAFSKLASDVCQGDQKVG